MNSTTLQNQFQNILYKCPHSQEFLWKNSSVDVSSSQVTYLCRAPKINHNNTLGQEEHTLTLFSYTIA